MEEKGPGPVKIVDRRSFTREGERREEEGTQPRQGADGAEGGTNLLPETTPFGEFILSLAATAYVSLGQLPDPNSGKQAPDLQTAAHIIDLLHLLQVKTSGNLDSGEEALFRDTLSQLMLLFVQVKEHPTGARLQ